MKKISNTAFVFNISKCPDMEKLSFSIHLFCLNCGRLKNAEVYPTHNGRIFVMCSICRTMDSYGVQELAYEYLESLHFPWLAKKCDKRCEENIKGYERYYK